MSERPVVLITGAAGGLGHVLAPQLAKSGYDLALFGSNEVRLTALAEGLSLPDDRHVELALDLKDPAATADAIDAVYERFGRVDALAHLVGGWTGGQRIADAPDEPFASMIDQHLWTTLNVVRVLSPRMVQAGRGRIVAVSSPLAAQPVAGMGAYSVGKAALDALMRTLAQEVRGSGVTVNVVRVRTIDNAHARDGDAHDREGKAPSDTASWTTPEEIAAAIGYLFSDDARVVNGEDLRLTSGY
jgi:NAD(P)-dependent dehydrogenase (short-subunit alcohol dehydrogenase family)